VSSLYQRPTDVAPAPSAITVDTGTEDSTYPKANLLDGLLHSPAKLTTTAGSWTLDYGAAQRIDVVALAYHNIDAGVSVKLQADADNSSWGAPTLDASIVIPGEDEDGRASMPWLDLTGVTGYSSGGFRYWRLIVGSNSDNISIGELGLWTPKRTLSRGVDAGFTTSDEHREIRHETEYGVLHRYRLGVRRRRFAGRVSASQQDLDDLRAWYREAAASDGVALWVPDVDENDAWWVRLPASGPDVTSRVGDLHDVALDFLEESGGGL